jgi:hypothetical protein
MGVLLGTGERYSKPPRGQAQAQPRDQKRYRTPNSIACISRTLAIRHIIINFLPNNLEATDIFEVFV